MRAERIPLAVYGTLRQGFGNHHLLVGRIQHIVPGSVAGYELVVDRIPYALPNPGATLVAEIVWPIPALYDQILADVDYLEGYNPHTRHNLYTRVAVTATTHQQREVEAWLYKAGPHALTNLAARPPVSGGDYANTPTRRQHR